MSDKIEVTGIEIKINGKKVILGTEDAWELKRELDKLLHTESAPYPYPVLPYVPFVPYTEPYTYPTWGNSTTDYATSGGFHSEAIDEETVRLVNQF